MASFRLAHRQTGCVIAGYRVTSASEEEIAKANWRLRETGSSYRFVIDLHPLEPVEPVCKEPVGNNPETASE